MHTLILHTQEGQEVRVHHTSDWSGDAEIAHPGGSAVLPGEVVQAILQPNYRPAPWSGVALVTFHHPWKLSAHAAQLIKEDLRRIIGPHTSAPVLLLEEGATIQLHGTDPNQPVGVLALSPEDVGLEVER